MPAPQLVPDPSTFSRGARRKLASGEHFNVRATYLVAAAVASAIHLLAKALSLQDEDVARLDSLEAGAHVARLPFYQRVRLLLLEVHPVRPPKEPKRMWALLVQDDTVLVLNGSGDPIHEANRLEGLELGEAAVPEYLRFFCAALRGDEGPFLLLEEPPPQQSPGHEALAAVASPLKLLSSDEHGRFRLQGVVAFGATAYNALFAVDKSGGVLMLEDTPLDRAIPPDALPNSAIILAPALKWTGHNTSI